MSISLALWTDSKLVDDIDEVFSSPLPFESSWTRTQFLSTSFKSNPIIAHVLTLTNPGYSSIRSLHISAYTSIHRFQILSPTAVAPLYDLQTPSHLSSAPSAAAV
mmetsp:Transcript_24205/g.38137  ORF Transcript_24205/g.38137 Transcript_24205/m.38137 type:complete len:105 (-) Transcript_24205:547-861(-)